MNKKILKVINSALFIFAFIGLVMLASQNVFAEVVPGENTDMYASGNYIRNCYADFGSDSLNDKYIFRKNYDESSVINVYFESNLPLENLAFKWTLQRGNKEALLLDESDDFLATKIYYDDTDSYKYIFQFYLNDYLDSLDLETGTYPIKFEIYQNFSHSNETTPYKTLTNDLLYISKDEDIQNYSFGADYVMPSDIEISVIGESYQKDSRYYVELENSYDTVKLNLKYTMPNLESIGLSNNTPLPSSVFVSLGQNKRYVIIPKLEKFKCSSDFCTCESSAELNMSFISDSNYNVDYRVYYLELPDNDFGAIKYPAKFNSKDIMLNVDYHSFDINVPDVIKSERIKFLSGGNHILYKIRSDKGFSVIENSIEEVSKDEKSINDVTPNYKNKGAKTHPIFTDEKSTNNDISQQYRVEKDISRTSKAPIINDILVHSENKIFSDEIVSIVLDDNYTDENYKKYIVTIVKPKKFLGLFKIGEITSEEVVIVPVDE